MLSRMPWEGHVNPLQGLGTVLSHATWAGPIRGPAQMLLPTVLPKNSPRMEFRGSSFLLSS